MEIKLLLIVVLVLLVNGCDNKSELNKSKDDINQVTKSIKDEKEKHVRSIDSLNKEISDLNKTSLEKKKEFASAEVYDIIKKSYLDHIIIGTTDFQNSISFMKEKLGFSIKNGRAHKNGLFNFFIEFEDSSEIEFMSMENNPSKLSSAYNELLRNNKFAFQFAIRTDRIIKLNKSLNYISAGFSEFEENKIYSTLSKSQIDQTLPLFFIEYYQKNIPSNFVHLNKSSGLSSVWIKTKNIKKNVRDFIEFGFSAIDTIKVGNFNSKTVLLKNNNFEIILIQSNEYAISGISIKTKDIEKFRTRINENLNLDLKIDSNKRGMSITLSPRITKSIWFEFIEN